MAVFFSRYEGHATRLTSVNVSHQADECIAGEGGPTRSQNTSNKTVNCLCKPIALWLTLIGRLEQKLRFMKPSKQRPAISVSSV